MKKVIEESQTLLKRIQPILDKVDLKRDMTKTIDLVILLGTYPNLLPCELAKKLMILRHQGKITNAEMTTILSNPKMCD